MRKLIEDMPLDSISVIDITKDSGVTRQTFYYHFKDVYDLIDWIYTSEAVPVLEAGKVILSWQQSMRQIFQYVVANKTLVYRTYHSRALDHLRNYLDDVGYASLMSVIDARAQSLKVDICATDKSYIANFYKYALVGLLLDWIGRGMVESPEKMIGNLDKLIQGDIDTDIKRFTT